MRLLFVGGNRPNTWSPGIVWAADEGKTEYPGGEDGVPLDVVFEVDLSFADVEGITSHW